MDEAARERPFDDQSDQSSRKRQRTSRGGSRSRSVDTVPGITFEDSQMPPLAPSTPPSDQLPPEPTSSRVTINLRTHQHLDTIPSSPPSPTTPSRMPAGLGDNAARASIESESDALSTAPAETPTSSPSAIESPEIELVTVDDDASEYGDREPQVAIIDDDDEVGYLDPLASFPYYAEGEALPATIRRLARYLQYGEYCLRAFNTDSNIYRSSRQ